MVKNRKTDSDTSSIARTPTKTRERSPSLQGTPKSNHTPTKRSNCSSTRNSTLMKEKELESSPDRVCSPRAARTPTKRHHSPDPVRILRTPTKIRELSPGLQDTPKSNCTPIKRSHCLSDRNGTPIKGSESSPDQICSPRAARTPTKIRETSPDSRDTPKSNCTPIKRSHRLPDRNGTPIKESESSPNQICSSRADRTPTKRYRSPDPARTTRTSIKIRETSPGLQDTPKSNCTPIKRSHCLSDRNGTPIKGSESSPDRICSPKAARTPTKVRETSSDSQDAPKSNCTLIKRSHRLSDRNGTPVKQSENTPNRVRTPCKKDRSPDPCTPSRTLRPRNKLREGSPSLKGISYLDRTPSKQLLRPNRKGTPVKQSEISSHRIHKDHTPDPETPLRICRTSTTSRTREAVDNIRTPVSVRASAISDTPSRSSNKLAPIDPLVCRENEFNTIYNYLREKISTRNSGYLYISGIPGSGKTATINRVIKKLVLETRTRSVKFNFIKINGQLLDEPWRPYNEILNQLKGDHEDERIENKKEAEIILNNIFNSRTDKDTPVVLLIDEMDRIYKRFPNVILNILAWHQKKNSQLEVLTIANDDGLMSSLLEKFKGKIDITNVQFNSYSDQQLKIIVLGEFRDDITVEDNAAEFLIKKFATKKGDARKVLDVCRLAFDIITENHGSVSVITLERMEEAVEKLSIHPYILAIKSCSIAEQILLRAVRDEIISNECYSLHERIYFQFQAICTLEGEYCPPIEDVCSSVCENLHDLGLLKLDTESAHIHTKIKLNVDAAYINIALKY